MFTDGKDESNRHDGTAVGLDDTCYRFLGKGFLTGRFDRNSTFGSDDFRSIVPRFTPENLDANQVLVDLVRKIAGGKNVTPPLDHMDLYLIH